MKRRIFYNGRILTMNDAQPTAGYVLTQGDRVVELGSADRVAAYLAEGVEPVDLQGNMMLPGFIDSHIHMLTAALNRLKLDISGMRFDTIEEMLYYIRREKENSSDSWISVFGFSEENIREGRMVTRTDLDGVFPNIPVTIIRVCGHMCVVNSAAIRRLNREKMEHICGGAFQKDEKGTYTGIATEGAQQYVLDSMPAADEETILQYLESEQRYLLQNGITAIHDAGTDMMLPRDYVAIYERLDGRKQLKLRTYLMLRPGDNELFASFDEYVRERRLAHEGTASRLQIGCVKLFADGSFGSRTAAVTEPYTGEPDNTGLLLNTRLNQYATVAADAGYQVAVHAIGDRATGYVANLYKQSCKREQDRLRIEHAELLDDGLIRTIRENKLLIMTQPIFIREFGNTYFNNLGQDRAMHIQPIKTLLENGVTVGFGTDYPVDSPDPFFGIHAAMTRQIGNSQRILNGDEAIDFTQAIKCYTIRNAYGAFSEDCMGTIEPGKYADFAIVSGLVSDADGQVTDVCRAKVEQTVIGGETVFTREG
ncbi:MAG: amidohydrolase [Clostridiales bacterium]|nr:amidohydrolase [Clostridiales bacterium]